MKYFRILCSNINKYNPENSFFIKNTQNIHGDKQVYGIDFFSLDFLLSLDFSKSLKKSIENSAKNNNPVYLRKISLEHAEYAVPVEEEAIKNLERLEELNKNLVSVNNSIASVTTELQKQKKSLEKEIRTLKKQIF